MRENRPKKAHSAACFHSVPDPPPSRPLSLKAVSGLQKWHEKDYATFELINMFDKLNRTLYLKNDFKHTNTIEESGVFLSVYFHRKQNGAAIYGEFWGEYPLNFLTGAHNLRVAPFAPFVFQIWFCACDYIFPGTTKPMINKNSFVA